MLKIFPKPDLSPAKQKENLEYDINRLQIRLEGLQGEFSKKSAELVSNFREKEADILRQTEDLERTLVIKRAERAELEKPLTNKIQDISDRELKLQNGVYMMVEKEKELSKREQDIETKEKTIEDFADDLGDRKLEAEKRIKLAEDKEKILKQKENEILLKIELKNEEYRQKDKEWNEKFAELDAIRIQTEATNENLEGREAVLLKEKRLLKDRQDLLLRNLKRI